MNSPSRPVRLMVQGRPDFSVGPKLQRTWGFREAAVFALEGLAATVMVGSARVGWLPGMIAAEAAMLIAVGLLFSHLGNPRAAWRAIVNIRRSWISRGTATIGGFVALGGVAIASRLWLPLPGPMESLLFWLQAATAGFILFYPGFAMAASAGIPFWTTGVLPLLSCLGGLSSGLAALVALAPVAQVLPFAADTAAAVQLGAIGAIAVGVLALVTAAQRMGAAARLSAQRLLTVEVLWFWTLAVGLGLALPAACYTIMMFRPDVAVPTAAAAALLRASGDVALRYALLKVGAFEALL
jgi:formate-dependent nitrite reductase membrane component NrfD